MYGIFTNICPKNHPNVGKYTIHVEYMGIDEPSLPAKNFPCWGGTFPNVQADCAAGVGGIVGALGEVAASGTLAMTSCKEFPLAGGSWPWGNTWESMWKSWGDYGKYLGNCGEIPGKYHEQDLLHMAISCNFIGNIDDIETNMGKVWENDEPKGLNHRDFIAFVGIRNGTACPKDFPRSPPFVSDMPSGNLTQLKEHQRFSEVNHLQTEHVPSLH